MLKKDKCEICNEKEESAWIYGKSLCQECFEREKYKNQPKKLSKMTYL